MRKEVFMKTEWRFSTVQLFLLYVTAMVFGGSLVSIVWGLGGNQPDFQVLPRVLLTLASLLLSLGIILKAREKK
jgi:hypothetical protein